MSLVGTLLATVAGLVLAALPASGHIGGRYSGVARAATRTVLNVLRAIPELVWVSILLIAAGRLEIVRLRTNSYCVSMAAVFYVIVPQSLSKLLSYTLYLWESNIRAEAILGVVGAGGITTDAEVSSVVIPDVTGRYRDRGQAVA